MRKFVLLSSAVLVAGCGEEAADIAHRAQLKVNFAQRLVSVSFELKPDFLLPHDSQISFDKEEVPLAKINLLGSRLSVIASPDALKNSDFDNTELTEFPNWSRLPKTVPSGGLKVIRTQNDDAEIDLLYQDSPYLIVGGSISAEVFSDLPIGFLAHQYFSDDNQNLTASLSIAGPTLTTRGGIYFIGTFGLNPFVIQSKNGSFALSLLPVIPPTNWSDLLIPLDLQLLKNRLDHSLFPWRVPRADE